MKLRNLMRKLINNSRPDVSRKFLGGHINIVSGEESSVQIDCLVVSDCEIVCFIDLASFCWEQVSLDVCFTEFCKLDLRADCRVRTDQCGSWVV